MPRGRKSKLRAREKRYWARYQTRRLCIDEATAAVEECLSSLNSGGSPPSSLGLSHKPQEAPATSSPEADVVCPRSDISAESQGEKNRSTSTVAPSMHSTPKDALTRKAEIVVKFLLERYKMNEPITQAALLKVIGRKYSKLYFPEVFCRVSVLMQLVYGLELKEVNPNNHSYALINILGLPTDSGLGGDKSVPKTGLLMNILVLIFTKGISAPEEETWKFLNVLGIHAGLKHHNLGEPKKLINKDLIQQNYLEYHQVPRSNPPRYEFLWGPRAYAETSKMKVLEILARFYGTIPTAFPILYEEALIDEEERAEMRAAARAKKPSKAKSYSSSRT